MSNNTLSTCDDCFNDEIGICFQCVERFNVCYNCVWYGQGELCDNCAGHDDEGIDISYFNRQALNIALEWIESNTRLCLDNAYADDYADDYFYEDYDY